jgi:CRP/FNR family transcriptional regulator, cyclic AMP receptor protein
LARKGCLDVEVTMDAEGLRSIPLFASLSDEARQKLATWVNEVSVSEGKHLVEEGDYSYDLFIIQDGTAEVLHDGEHVADLGPGDFFGEMGILQKAQRGATVVAKSPMELATLSSWDVKRLKRSAPEVLDQLTAAIEERSQER